jgi:molybdate transport system substrate-binding protein
MKRPILALTAASALALASIAQAADLDVIASNGVRAALEELAPQFEKASGNKVSIKWGVAAVMQREIEGGAAFDLALLTTPAIAELAKQGKIAAGSETPIARSAVGIMVRKGAQKPDLSSPVGLMNAVLAAKSITWAKEGASGTAFLNALQKIGIAEEAKRKADLAADGAGAAQKVASGQAEFGALLVNEIMAQPGVDLAGPLPGALQTYTPFSSGLSATTKNADAAKALVNHLTSPESRAVFKAKGQEPPAAP